MTRGQFAGIRGSALTGLLAPGPAPGLEERLQLFGQFVGDWAILDQRFPLSDRRPERRRGEVHFRWVLGGRAVQDVWGPRDPRTGRFLPVGTTVRFYDAGIRGWRSVWISPYQAEVRAFVGRLVGPEIVLREQHRSEARREHWIFSDIRPGSFRWRAEQRPAGGKGWVVVEEMQLARIPRRESAASFARPELAARFASVRADRRDAAEA